MSGVSVNSKSDPNLAEDIIYRLDVVSKPKRDSKGSLASETTVEHYYTLLGAMKGMRGHLLAVDEKAPDKPNNLSVKFSRVPLNKLLEPVTSFAAQCLDDGSLLFQARGGIAAILREDFITGKADLPKSFNP